MKTYLLLECWGSVCTQCELTHTNLTPAWINSRKDNFVFSVGNELNVLGKEQNSNFFFDTKEIH